MFDRATDRLCLPARRRAVSERRAIVGVFHRPVADRLPSTVHDSTRAKMPAAGKNARGGQKRPVFLAPDFFSGHFLVPSSAR